jgi:hypothetical protein
MEVWRVPARRAINGDAGCRGQIDELVISNRPRAEIAG